MRVPISNIRNLKNVKWIVCSFVNSFLNIECTKMNEKDDTKMYYSNYSKKLSINYKL
jgi:hypothetical protein